MSIAASAGERGAEAAPVTALRAVHVVVPGDIDDVARCSGGNVYDRRLCRALAGAGRAVHAVPVAGRWPHPEPAARAALAAALAAVPDGAAVLVDGLVACGVPEIMVPASRRVAVVVLVHLPLGDETGADPRLVARERETLTAATGVVATSPWTARRLVAVHGLDPDRVVVAAPGVDPAPLAPGTDGTVTVTDPATTRPPCTSCEAAAPRRINGEAAAQTPHLLCVGSITPTKGQDLLVAALARVADLPWSCDLVGPVRRDPAHVAAVTAAVRQHGLDGRVRMRGPRVGTDLDAAYAAADLLAVPSRAETYGMVVTEALARGIPVLAADVGGLAETLGRDPAGRVPGLLVPPDDPAALGEALQDWMEQPLLRNGLRRSARERRGMLDGWEVTSRCASAALERWTGTRG